MFSVDIPPRPTTKSEEVKLSAVDEAFPEICEWLTIHGSSTEDLTEIRVHLTLAMMESEDAYEAAKYLEDFMEWPVTMELVRIIDRMHNRLPILVRPHIQQWVLAHRVRFSATKGNVIKFRLGSTTLRATLTTIIPSEAVGYAIIPSQPGKALRVNAEDITEIVRPENWTKAEKKAAGL